MTAESKEKIFRKIQNLDEYAAHLEQLVEETKDDKEIFLKDFHMFGTAERYLQLSIQALMDAVKIIIVNEGLEKPEDNQETISLLYNKKIISGELAGRLDGIVGFRNILVHEYDKIDKERVYVFLQEKIGDFKLFKKEILEYLK